MRFFCCSEEKFKSVFPKISKETEGNFDDFDAIKGVFKKFCISSLI